MRASNHQLQYLLLYLTLTLAQLPDHTLWDNVLRRHITSGTIHLVTTNVVDYEGIRMGDADFVNYLEVLANVDESNLTVPERKALLLNAYNALAVSMVVDNPCKIKFGKFCWPSQSIRDLGGFFKSVWNLPAGTVAHKSYTLKMLETRIRTEFKDPRMHMCMVSASVSSPDLPAYAYRSAVIDAQMNESVRNFLNNTQKGLTINEAQKTMTVSSIFMWYMSDFISGSPTNGTTYGSTLDFIAGFNSGAYALVSKYRSLIGMDSFGFDWDLNSLFNVKHSYLPFF